MENQKIDRRKNRGKCTPEELEARRKRKAEREQRWKSYREGQEAKERYEAFLHQPWWMSRIEDKERKIILNFFQRHFNEQLEISTSLTNQCTQILTKKKEGYWEEYLKISEVGRKVSEEWHALYHFYEILRRMESRAISDLSVWTREN